MLVTNLYEKRGFATPKSEFDSEVICLQEKKKKLESLNFRGCGFNGGRVDIQQQYLGKTRSLVANIDFQDFSVRCVSLIMELFYGIMIRNS